MNFLINSLHAAESFLKI